MLRIIQFSLALCLITTSMMSQSTRNLKEFFSVDVSTSIEAELIKSNAYKIDIDMIKGDESDVISDINGGTLKVKIKGKDKWGRNNSKAKVKIYYVRLEGIEVSAGALVTSDEIIQSKSMVVSTSSGSNCNIKVESEKITAESSSGSRLSLKGHATESTYEASSGASLNAEMLESQNSNAEVSSGASISLWATKKLIAEASSGGNISYKGEPEELKKSTGMSGGSIKKK